MDEVPLRDREEADYDDWEMMDIPEYRGETVETCPVCGQLLIYRDWHWEDRDVRVEVYDCERCDEMFYFARKD